MKKELFDKNEKYTKEANALEKEINLALLPIFQEWKEKRI